MELLSVRVPAAALHAGPGAHDVHTARWGPGTPGTPAAPASDAVPIVLVHGLGGSHVNWALAAPLLARPGRPVWAPDLCGFGLTMPQAPGGGRRGARIDENLDLLAGFVATVTDGGPATLVGNSMGGLLAILLAAQRPALVAGLVVVNPALPPPLRSRIDRRTLTEFSMFALPGLGERWVARRIRRHSPAAQVAETMALCTADPQSLDPDAIRAHVRMAARRRAMPHASAAFLQASRDLVRRITVGRAALWRDVARVTAPTLFVQGAKDRLMRPEVGAQLLRNRPDWAHRHYPDLGHVPMLEDPERFAADVEAFLGDAGGRATA